MLPFSRKVPRRAWLGFVDAPSSRGSSLGWVISGLGAASVALLLANGGSASASEGEATPPHTAPASNPAQRTPSPAPSPSAAHAPPRPSTPSSLAAAAPPPATPPTGAAQRARPRRPPPAPPQLTPSAQRRAKRNAYRLRTPLANDEVLRTPGSFAVLAIGRDTSWADAQTQCQSLSVAGVGGWKLPSRREARELQRGGALSRSSGAFWTKQRSSRHDDAIFVYNTRTRRSAAWLEEEIAAVICVQPAPR